MTEDEAKDYAMEALVFVPTAGTTGRLGGWIFRSDLFVQDEQGAFVGKNRAWRVSAPALVFKFGNWKFKCP